jgi:type IV secretion system protein VirB3
MNKPFLSLRDSTQIVLTTLLSVSLPLLATGSAHAAGSNMPWEQPLQQVLQSVEGPVAKILAVIIIITTGLTLAFGDTSGGFPPAHPDHFRPVDRLRRVELFPDVLFLRRRGAGLMGGILSHESVAGFDAPVHRALTDPILLGGAPRAVAIANGTLAAAVGLGLRLWIPGLVIWAIGHAAAVWAAKRDAQFVDVVRRHLRYPAHFGV